MRAYLRWAYPRFSLSLLTCLHVFLSLPVPACVGICTLERKSLSTHCACLCVLLLDCQKHPFHVSCTKSPSREDSFFLQSVQTMDKKTSLCLQFSVYTSHQDNTFKRRIPSTQREVELKKAVCFLFTPNLFVAFCCCPV